MKERKTTMGVHKTMLRTAFDLASHSAAKRLKVGAIIRNTYRRVIASGYNHVPFGMPEACEDENNVTHPYVIHAEQEALMSAAKKGKICQDATMYVTASPCIDCAKLIIASGIKRVIYGELYRDSKGIDLLKQNGVEVVQIDFKE